MSKLSSISSSKAVASAPSAKSSSSDRPVEIMAGARRKAFAERGRRIMRWLVVGMILSWVLGNVFVDLCPMAYRFPEGAYVVKHVPTGADSPFAITFGNSRFRCGLYADELGKIAGERLGWDHAVDIYSGAVPAGTSITFDVLFQKMMQRGASPKMLIVEISPETVGNYAPWLGFDVMRHLNFFQAWGALPDGYRSRTQSRILSSRLVPLYRHNLHLVDWALGAMGFAGDEEPGALMAEPNYINHMQGPINDEAMRRWFRKYHVGGIQVECMDRLLGWCKERGIEVLLVGTPVSSPHRAHYRPEVQREYLAYIDTLKARFGASFMDFSGRIADKDFADHHHLLESGGHAFTRMVAEEYLAPRMRKMGIGAP